MVVLSQLNPSTPISCLNSRYAHAATSTFSFRCMDLTCRNSLVPQSCSASRNSQNLSSEGYQSQNRRRHGQLCTPFLPQGSYNRCHQTLKRTRPVRSQPCRTSVQAVLGGGDLASGFSKGGESMELLMSSLRHLNSAILFRYSASGAEVSGKTEQAAQLLVELQKMLEKGTSDFLYMVETAMAQAWMSVVIGQIATAAALEVETLRVVGGSSVRPLVDLTSMVATGFEKPEVTLAVVVAVLAVAVTGVLQLSADSVSARKEDSLPLRYDPDAIARYFRKRPVEVLARSAKIVAECSALAASIMVDRQTGRLQQNEALRAQQLRDLITNLGPTAIKAGQALSIRPDLLSAAYLAELQKLQDRVPPFSNEEAQQLILEGLSAPADAIFSELSSEPVAAASLGQVYKGRLREGGEVVAVKVQRPGVLEGISCDLFVLRIAASAVMRWPSVKSDLVAVLDTWAMRFFDELDYEREAQNAIRFTHDMSSLPNITIAQPFLDFTSRKILTTAWVEGEKLSESTAEDVGPLVNSMLACYLTQLLESGFLHADPHPGNLLRTQDGKLCVLDFGLMTEVTENQRYALIDYIAHLVNGDFDRVADDLVRLGFVPPDSVNAQKTEAVTPLLARVLTQLAQGGGARKLNVQQVTEDLSKMSQEYTFVIPPYFALILRAFGVLEGIGLEADPDYAIVDECYPYLAKRLLTDDSPRTQAALRYLLYGTKAQLDVERVETLAASFQKFQQVTAPVSSSEPPVSSGTTQLSLSRRRSQGVDPAAKQALLLLFAPEGSFIQELLLTEMVRAVDALSREALAELWGFFVRRRVLPLPPPLRVLAEEDAWPLLPGLLLIQTRGLRMGRLTAADRQALSSVRRIWALLEPHLSQPSSAAQLAGIARDSMPLWGEILPGVTTAAQRFVVMLLQRQVLRFADDLDGQASLAHWERDPFSIARQIGPSKLVKTLDKKNLKEGDGQKILQPI